MPCTALQIGAVTHIDFCDTYPYNYAVTSATRVRLSPLFLPPSKWAPMCPGNPASAADMGAARVSSTGSLGYKAYSSTDCNLVSKCLRLHDSSHVLPRRAHLGLMHRHIRV